MPLLLKRLENRKRAHELEQIADYRIRLQIATAPHTREGAGITNLMSTFEQMEKDIKNPERVQSRRANRAKLEEMLLAQINASKEG